MAETLAELVPSLEMLRLCNSGTEATMSCVRLARGFSGRFADKTLTTDGLPARATAFSSPDWERDESYSSLAISLLALGLGHEENVLMITSAGPQDGKTSVTLGLAAALAELGHTEDDFLFADGVRGDSANNVQKPAVLETGLSIQVPLFIKERLARMSAADHRVTDRRLGAPDTLIQK